MDIVSGIVIVVVVAVLAIFFRNVTSQKCPKCGASMKLRVRGARTKKFECLKCGKKVDTGVPSGKGRR